MSVTGAARGTSQRRLFYRCGASIYRGRGRLGAVRSVCRTAGLGVGRAIVCSPPGRMLLHGGVARSIVGAPPRCEAKADQHTEPVRSHPGRVLLQGGGDAFSCRSTASVRTESNQYTEPAPFAPGAGAPTGGVTRSVVGAPPRCEAKANQNTEPVPFAPGAGAPTGWGGAFDCRSTASVRSEGKPIHRACPVRTRGGCSYGVGWCVRL